MADRVGFEPTVRVDVHTSSNRAPSTTQPSIHVEIYYIQKIRFVNTLNFNYNNTDTLSNTTTAHNKKSTQTVLFCQQSNLYAGQPLNNSIFVINVPSSCRNAHDFVSSL